MSKLIVIVGVTGIQGSCVAETFLKLSDWRVRGISRTPSSPAAQALASKGVDVVKGDFDDKESLIPAFQGALAIYANTDYFGHFFSALSSQANPNQYAYGREVEQGMKIAEAAAGPAVLETLEHFIFSSLSDATKWSKGKYTKVYHNDSKAAVIEGIETRFSALAKRMSTLQVGHYVRNWQGAPFLRPKKQDDGTYLWPRTFGPEFKMPFIVAQEDTGAFVKALIDLPVGTNLLGVSEYMTWPAWVELWGKTLGVEAEYKHVTHDEFWQGAPEALKVEFVDNFRYLEEFGMDGGDPDVKTAVQLGIKVPVTSMEEYIKTEDWSSIL